MTKRSKTALATAGVAVALAAGAGGALAGGGPGGHGLGGPGPGSPAVAAYLGLGQDELRTRLESGLSLAAIAAAQGKTVAGLEDAILADAKTHLDAEVAAGRITAAEEADRLADLKAHLADIVARTGPPAGGPGPPPFEAAAAAYIGVTQAGLRTQLRAGVSLAQVATANGKTVAGLKAAILADAKQHLDAAVTAGKLTQAQATARLAELTERIDDLVDRTGAPPRP